MTQYIVTGRNQGVPRPPHVDLIPDVPNTVFSATFDSGVEAELIGSGLIATYPLPHDVTVRGSASAGQVPTATSATDATWQAGGGGVTVPLSLEAASGPVLELGTTGEAQPRNLWEADGTYYWTDGTNPPQIRLVLDPVNESNSWLALFPENGAPQSGFSMYGPHQEPDGTMTASNAASIQMYAGGGNADIEARAWSGAGGAQVQVLSDTSTDDGHFLGQVNVRADPAYTGLGDVTAIGIKHGFGDFFAIHYDGSLNWTDTRLQDAGAGVLEITQDGGGLRLTSPNGLTTKTLTIDDSGALALI